MAQIKGLHHVTAIANNAQRNLDFYTKILGLRLVKKTVNFDDPGTYHFYFGDEKGTPGTILTFFPWQGIGSGKNGTGMATDIRYAIPEGSLPFWLDRFKQHKVEFQQPVEKMNETHLSFSDPDGLHLSLIIPDMRDERTGWLHDEINETNALKGFHSVSLSLRNADPTIRTLTEVLGYEIVNEASGHFRLKTGSIETASVIDIVEDVKGGRGLQGAGSVHHIAFRVKDEADQMIIREKIMDAGLMPTAQIDRQYFYSVYFREPGGVLFEIATENPGFTTDESLNLLGTHLMLPAQYEATRSQIEKALPTLTVNK